MVYSPLTKALAGSCSKSRSLSIDSASAALNSVVVNTNLDTLITKLKVGSKDPYDVLTEYIIYLKNNSAISTATLKVRIITAKNFLEYNDVDITPRKFKLKVKIPKVVRKTREAIDKEEIVEILNACSNIRLKTYVMLAYSLWTKFSKVTNLK